MKILKIYIILLFSLLSLSVWSQKKEAIAMGLESTPSLTVKCELLQFNKKTQNGYSTLINSTVDMAEKQWKQFIETNYNAEVKKSKGGLVSENVTAAGISDLPITITVFFKEDENGCRLKAFYERDGSYIDDKENPQEHTGVTNQLRSFLKKLYVITFEEVLTEQRKIQEDEVKKLDKLDKESEKIAKDINSEETSVQKAEDDIIDAQAKIAELQAKIKGLKGKIQESKATKNQLIETMNKKTQEVMNQKSVVEESASRIEKIKSSAEKMN